MVFLIIKHKIQNSNWKKWRGDQKFIKNSLKLNTKMSLVIIEN